MKNLENYGVQTLNAKEIRETEGGLIFIGPIYAELSLGRYVLGFLAGLGDGLRNGLGIK